MVTEAASGDAGPTAAGSASASGRSLLLLHLLAGGVVAAGVIAQVTRPTAPPVPDLPPASRWFDADHLALVDQYWTPVYALAAVSLLLRVAIPVLVAATPQGRALVERVADRFGRRPVVAAAAVATAMVAATDLLLAPLAYWRGFVHESAYGFRTSGVGGWLYDWAAARIPGWAAVALLAALAMWLARRLPRAWPGVAALAGAGLTALLVFAAPYLLEPLRFSMEPLPEGPVRAEVDAVIAASGLQVDRVLVADASRRTTRHNAYVSGLGRSRRMVLYDNLVAQRPVEEVAMVSAHELGHKRNADLARGTLTGMAGVVMGAYAIGAFVRWRVRSGRQAEAADVRGVAAVVALVVLLNTASMPVQSALSRTAEAAADFAALELTADPDTFITKNRELARTNLSHPAPPAWVRFLWSSHPPAVARLEMGERYRQQILEG